MRLTSKLNAQHIGFYFKKHWENVKKQVVRDTGAIASLEKLNIKVSDPKEFLKDKKDFLKIEVHGYRPPAIQLDRAHPDWKPECCYIMNDNDVPFNGEKQMQVLLKTVEIPDFPQLIKAKIEKIRIPTIVDNSFQNDILTSHIFDAEQEKLAILRDPNRPAVTPPRNYGITDGRRNTLLISKLIHECDKIVGRSLNAQRRILNNAKFIATFEKENDKIQFNLGAETLITSKSAINYVEENYDDLPLLDIFPLRYTVGIPKTNIYKNHSFYPVTKNIAFSHPHTILLHFSSLDVKNLHELPVTELQFQSRTLMKAFTAAAARAKQLYGEFVNKLPEPLVVQAVHTDGRAFHFGIFQLNTLDLDGVEGEKNYWFHLPKINLFEECSYKIGAPVFSGYNPDVLKYMAAFYAS